jgi:peptide/nickel transport system ATP-binding protein
MSDAILLASDVSFNYEAPKNARPILQNVSISIEPGSIVAIVGESGSGKSTLAKLLCGMLTPTSGQVLYRGAPLQSPAEAGLHLLSQEPFSTFNPYHDLSVTAGVG